MVMPTNFPLQQNLMYITMTVVVEPLTVRFGNAVLLRHRALVDSIFFIFQPSLLKFHDNVSDI